MRHFADSYCDVFNERLHEMLPATWQYRQELHDFGGIGTALLVTYDDVKDDSRVYLSDTWETFLVRMSQVKPDWADLSKEIMLGLAAMPDKSILGWEGRTIFVIKGGANPQYWTPKQAHEDSAALRFAGQRMQGIAVEAEINSIDVAIPIGNDGATAYERLVRVAFSFLFRDQLTNGRAQVRTEPGNEGVEIRDVIFTNSAERGFWKDLKSKYHCSEVVIDAKNTNDVTRGDLRQIYCYLKPALGLWGFIVCRAPQPEKLHTFNRTLFKNFTQTRGCLILSQDDLRRMVQIAKRGKDASEYLSERMAEFVRGV
jgi:hypothetical protein